MISITGKVNLTDPGTKTTSQLTLSLLNTMDTGKRPTEIS